LPFAAVLSIITRVGYDKGYMMTVLFTVVFTTEMGDVFTYKDLTKIKVNELLLQWLDETIVETKITPQD
jgi:hypothetical protein